MALTAWELAQPELGPQTSIPSPGRKEKGSVMCPVKQVPGPAVGFVRGMLRRERRAEREASR